VPISSYLTSQIRPALCQPARMLSSDNETHLIGIKFLSSAVMTVLVTPLLEEEGIV
jgi:hypothetical protein